MHVHSTLNLSFINLEDDSFLLVKRLDNKFLDVLKSWYLKSTTMIDIEHLDIEFVGNEKRQTIKFGADIYTTYTESLEKKYQPNQLKEITYDSKSTREVDTEVLQVTYDTSYGEYNTDEFLSCIYNYNFLNRKNYEKKKFLNGYLQKLWETEEFISGYVQIYVNQLILQKQMKSYKYSYCFEKNGGGQLFERDKSEEKSFNEFEAQRQSLFDIDKLGITIPEIFLKNTSVFFDLTSHHELPISPILFPKNTSNKTLENIISKPLPYTISSRQGTIMNRPEIPILIEEHLKQEIESIPSYTSDSNRYTPIYDVEYVSHVILNFYDYSTFVLTENLTRIEEIILTELQEYGFVKLISYQTKNITIVEQIKLFFDDKPCQTPDIINKNLDMIAKYMSLFGDDISNDKSIFEDEESRIRKLFNQTFIIDHAVENKIKASKIYNVLLRCIKKNKNNPISNEINMRKRISIYLNKIGLQKKRCKDGYYYYYGIKFNTFDNLIIENYNPLLI